MGGIDPEALVFDTDDYGETTEFPPCQTLEEFSRLFQLPLLSIEDDASEIAHSAATEDPPMASTAVQEGLQPTASSQTTAEGYSTQIGQVDPDFAALLDIIHNTTPTNGSDPPLNLANSGEAHREAPALPMFFEQQAPVSTPISYVPANTAAAATTTSGTTTLAPAHTPNHKSKALAKSVAASLLQKNEEARSKHKIVVAYPEHQQPKRPRRCAPPPTLPGASAPARKVVAAHVSASRLSTATTPSPSTQTHVESDDDAIGDVGLEAKIAFAIANAVHANASRMIPNPSRGVPPLMGNRWNGAKIVARVPLFERPIGASLDCVALPGPKPNTLMIQVPFTPDAERRVVSLDLKDIEVIVWSIPRGIDDDISSRRIATTPPSHFVCKYAGPPNGEVDCTPKNYDRCFLFRNPDPPRLDVDNDGVAEHYVQMKVTFDNPAAFNARSMQSLILSVRDDVGVTGLRCLTTRCSPLSELNPRQDFDSEKKHVTFLVHRDDAYTVRCALENKQSIVEDELFEYRGCSVTQQMPRTIAQRAVGKVMDQFPSVKSALFSTYSPSLETSEWKSRVHAHFEQRGVMWSHREIAKALDTSPQPLYAYVYYFFQWLLAPTGDYESPAFILPPTLTHVQKAQMQDAFYWRYINPSEATLDPSVYEDILSYYDSVGWNIYLLHKHVRHGKNRSNWASGHKYVSKAEYPDQEYFDPSERTGGLRPPEYSTSSQVTRTPVRFFEHPSEPETLKCRFEDQKKKKKNKTALVHKQ